MSAEFDKVWRYLQGHLHIGMVIRNWTVLKGYYGEDFAIHQVSSDTISVDAPGAKTIQVVPVEDFQAVWDIWAEYLSDDFPRHKIRNITRFSKYIIGILHWYEEEVSNA